MTADRHILAIDTAWAACSVAVTCTAGPAAASEHQSNAVARHEPMTTGHAERLFPMVREVMAEAGLAFRDLDAVAVTVGPGSFTGVRVGIAAARGLALATKLPTLGATSLAPLARLAAKQRHSDGLADTSIAGITVVQDARRGNVFVQTFDANGQTPLTDAALVAVDELPTFALPETAHILTGSASDMLRDAKPGTSFSLVSAETANGVDSATALALTEVDLLEMSPIKPLYLRPPDAKAQVGKSLLRQSP